MARGGSGIGPEWKKGASAMGATSSSRRHFLQGAAYGAGAVAVGLSVAGTAAAAPGGTGSPVADRSTRRRDTFDFDWKFVLDDPAGAEQPGFDDASWRKLDLPHDWSIEGPFSQSNPAGGPGGYLPGGIGWYRKTFTAPESLRGQRVSLNFDGVYMNSTVWVNGHLLGERPYGFVPFTYDLTSYLNYGHDNTVAVRVDNSKQPNCRWYTGSGIYRHTWLISTQPVHVAECGTFVRTPRVDAHAATVEIETRVANDQRSTAHAIVTTTLLDAAGVKVGETSRQTTLPGGRTGAVDQRISVADPHLWSTDDPYLYTARTTVQVEKAVVDSYDTPFGIRSAVFDAKQGFLLNGVRTKMLGVCVHPDLGCLGAAVVERGWQRRLEILKRMGCNAIRLAHNPREVEFLDLCDRMGFLVMDDAFDEWTVPKPQTIPNGYCNYFDEWYEEDLLAMIRRDRNHPSVVLWDAGNEVGDQAVPDGAKTLKKIVDIFHREDPTRKVTVACDRIVAEPLSDRVTPEFLAGLDVVGYNYVDRWRNRRELYYSIDHDAYPNRPVVGTESSAMRGTRGATTGLAPGASPSIGSSIDVEQLWKYVHNYDYVSGDFMWTGIDYLGEASWPSKSASSGQIDTCGFEKDGFYFYQSQWISDPVLHLFPHWNWQGQEGKRVTVMCYTNCDTVELFLNDKSLGVRGYQFPRLGMQDQYGTYPPEGRQARTTGDLHLTWEVPYEAGTLRAVGRNLDTIVATTEITTTGQPASVALQVDLTSIAADRRDVCHVTAAIVDAQGLVVPTASDQVTFQVQGPAQLIGVDSGNPASHESYQSSQRAAFNGRLLAVVRSTAQAGTVTVTASAPGLNSATVGFTTG